MSGLLEPPQGFRSDPGRLAEFGRQVAMWHQVLPYERGESPLCTCRQFAVLCPYVRLAHDVLGMPVPWSRARPPLLFGSA